VLQREPVSPRLSDLIDGRSPKHRRYVSAGTKRVVWFLLLCCRKKRAATVVQSALVTPYERRPARPYVFRPVRTYFYL